MTRSAAIAIVARFAFNFAVQKAKAAMEDAIDALPNDKLGWWEMQDVYRNVAKELAEIDSFYLWSCRGIDSDEFTVAKWALGEDVVQGAVRSQFRCMTPDTLELLGQAKLEHRKRQEEDKEREAAKEHESEWRVRND
jgi:hypothetical protein